MSDPESRIEVDGVLVRVPNGKFSHEIVVSLYRRGKLERQTKGGVYCFHESEAQAAECVKAKMEEARDVARGSASRITYESDIMEVNEPWQRRETL